jgi:Na+-transporting NADH:ubiquinone oxidoreductase subunit NqrC
MTNLNKTRHQFTVALAVLCAIDLALIIYLLLPGSSPSARLEKEKSLQEQVTALQNEVKPLEGIGDKLATTRKDVQKFYEQKIPSEFSQISQHLYKLRQETDVNTTATRYQEEKNSSNEKNELPEVRRIQIETTVSGEYEKVARFINAMEQDKYVFIINQISLNSQEGGVVSLQIKFETFLRQT